MRQLNRQLIKNARFGNLKGIIYWINQGAKLDTYIDKILYITIKNGNLDIFHYLVEHGTINVNYAFRMSAIYGQLDIFSLFTATK